MAQHLTIGTKDDFIQINGNGEEVRCVNDIFIGKDGNLAMPIDKDALANISVHVARTNRGELMYNTSKGIPYMTTVFRSIPNIPLWQAYLKSAIESIPGITQVADMNVDINATDGHVSYDITMSSNIGDITING